LTPAPANAILPPDMSSNLEAAKQYLAAIAAGATRDQLAAFFDPEVVQQEFPNRLTPDGATRGLTEILEGAERGQKVLRSQRYEVLRAVTSGEHVGLEVQWTGILAIPLAGLPPGGVMRARFAVFLDYRDGKIAQQRNYDCFEPW
jgi:ketosteroid isomerase-like protein